jgi:hypothetical protein
MQYLIYNLQKSFTKEVILMNPCAGNMSISALACAIAQGKSDNEISLLSAMFTQLGDSLATMVAIKICNEESNENNNDEEDEQLVVT